ncbi:MAG TPA: antibiotic biosynthesis monooxygenase family protein [Ktedonobacterales bacterium]
MVLEIAQYTAQLGKADELQTGLLRAVEVIRRAKGCVSATPRRQVEDPDRFVVTIEWETLDDHLVGFRGSPQFQEYRSHLTGLFVDPIVALHYLEVGA